MKQVSGGGRTTECAAAQGGTAAAAGEEEDLAQQGPGREDAQGEDAGSTGGHAAQG